MAEPTEIAGKIAGKARAVTAAIAGYKGIFRKLFEEHTEVNTIMMRLASSDNPELRSELFPIFRAELISHAHAEEEEVYPVFLSFSELKNLTEHGIDEHHEIEDMVDRLAAMDVNSPGWKPLFLQIKDAVTDHVDEEQDIVFPKAKELINDEETDRMRDRFMKVKERELAKLRPH